MTRFITKNVLVAIFVSVGMFLGAILLWGMIVYMWFQSTVQHSLSKVVSRAQTEIAQSNTELSKDSRDQIRLAFTDLEQSKEIVTFAVLNLDKSLNYTEGIRKRDNILWKLNVLYPLKMGDRITGWIKVWPSPELVLNSFFSEKNVLILFITFLLAISLVFALSILYFVKTFLLPLDEFRKTIKNISNGNVSDIKFKYDHGIWKDMGVSLKKLNSKVLDINTTVQMLFSVSKALTSQVEMNQIFNVIMGIIQKKFPDAMCAVILPGEDGSLKIAAKRGYSQGFNKSIRMEDGNPVADAFIMGKMTVVKDLNALDDKYVKEFKKEGALTQINIPLTDENGLSLGVLNVSGKTGDIFDTDIAETISTVGKYLSIALRNAKMYDKAQELNRRLETEINITSNELIQTNARLIRKVRDIKALSDISAFASAKFDLSSITTFVIQKIMELTGMETSAVMIEDPSTGEFFFVCGSFSISCDQLSQIRLSPENSEVLKYIKQKRRTVVYPNTSDIKQNAPEFFNIISMSSAAFVPIENNGKVAGLLVSINKFGAEISDNDINIIEHIAVLVAGILQKVRLYSELEKKVNNLTFLQRISTAVSSAQDMGKTLEKIIDVTKDAFKADLCAVLLYDKNTGQLITQPGAFFTGGSGKVLLKIDKNDKNSLSAKTFREGVPYLSKDATADPTIKSQSAKEWGIKSIIIVPLKSDNEVIGVLRVGKHEPNAYSEEDKNLIIMIASQAAMIIENANLYDALSHHSKTNS